MNRKLFKIYKDQRTLYFVDVCIIDYILYLS